MPDLHGALLDTIFACLAPDFWTLTVLNQFIRANHASLQSCKIMQANHTVPNDFYLVLDPQHLDVHHEGRRRPGLMFSNISLLVTSSNALVTSCYYISFLLLVVMPFSVVRKAWFRSFDNQALLAPRHHLNTRCRTMLGFAELVILKNLQDIFCIGEVDPILRRLRSLCSVYFFFASRCTRTHRRLNNDSWECRGLFLAWSHRTILSLAVLILHRLLQS